VDGPRFESERRVEIREGGGPSEPTASTCDAVIAKTNVIESTS